ncbi:MAG: AMP-binding protein, partial [Lysobacter sp.]
MSPSQHDSNRDQTQTAEATAEAFDPLSSDHRVDHRPDLEQHRLLLHTWNATDLDYPRDLCLHRLFEQQVQTCPDAIALAHRDRRLSYAQLNAQANRLAHRLIELGVSPDDRVALCVQRGPAAIVGLLAVLKAGGAYVPFDPGHASARLAHMLADAAPVAVLIDAVGRAALGEPALRALTVLDLDTAALDSGPDHDPQPAQLRPHHLAYVIYTSG